MNNKAQFGVLRGLKHLHDCTFTATYQRKNSDTEPKFENSRCQTNNTISCHFIPWPEWQLQSPSRKSANSWPATSSLQQASDFWSEQKRFRRFLDRPAGRLYAWTLPDFFLTTQYNTENIYRFWIKQTGLFFSLCCRYEQPAYMETEGSGGYIKCQIRLHRK